MDCFRDPRLKKLARRLVYFERPDLLADDMRARMDQAIRDRLNGLEPGAPGRTFASTLEEFDRLLAEAGVITPSLANYREHLQAQMAQAA